ncbi:hypothetical protein ACFSQ7_08615 [Paenibacillus rhizoplanae]
MDSCRNVADAMLEQSRPVRSLPGLVPFFWTRAQPRAYLWP